MSLPWNRSIQLQLGSRSVVGTLRAGWPRNRTLARASRDVSVADPADAETAIAACREAMDAVLTELQSKPGARGCPLSVWLAGERVHIDVVTGDYRGTSERQLQTIANACVDDVIGHRASPQVVRWQLQPGLRHLLIAAMAARDVEAVVQVAAQQRVPLGTLQPAFCARWNRLVQALPGGSGVFAVVDGGHAEVGFVQKGAISAWSSGRCEPAQAPARARDGAARSELDQRTDRLLASLGERTEAVPAFVLAMSGGDDLVVAPRWQVNRWQEALA